MQYRRLTTALIATLALFTVSCKSSRTVTHQTHNEAIHDTVIETVTLTLHDTIRETTTITIQTNETGDTTHITTNRDREKITSRNRTANHSHHLTQSETTNATKEITQTTPISPIQPIKPLAIAFILGLLSYQIIKIVCYLKSLTK